MHNHLFSRTPLVLYLALTFFQIMSTIIYHYNALCLRFYIKIVKLTQTEINGS